MPTPVPRFLGLLLCWGLVAVAAGAVHLLAHLPPYFLPLFLLGLTTSFSLALVRVGWMRRAAGELGVRSILAFHLTRYVGLYFLWLQGQGRLPVEFAQRAGWGDIVAATAALGLWCWPEGPGFRRALFWWNLLGAADLLVAVGTGGWLNVTRPGSMIELAGLPLGIVPLWLVPMLLASHFFLLRQHICARRESEPKTAGTLPANPAN